MRVAMWLGVACCGLAGCYTPDEPGGSDGADAVDGPDTSAGDVEAADGVGDAGGEEVVDLGRPYPPPGDRPPNRGPGGPATSFEEADLYAHCAYLNGGELDVTDHHNLLVMYDGYLLMPWAPEWGGGGLTFWEFTDPCEPVSVGTGYSETMRESHSIGFSGIRGRWAVVDSLEQILAGGIEFWDVSDPTAPEVVSTLNLPDFVYPDAYARVVLSVFWQAPYVYAAGSDNGVYIVDAEDPREPELVAQYVFDPILRAGQVQAVGNLLVVTAAEGSRVVLLDISDPADPQPIPGGDFHTHDGEGVQRDNYFSNLGGGYTYHARKDGGGGVIVYDISDPTNPTFAGDYASPGNGGYVFVKDDLAFVGESSFAGLYDLSDLTNIEQVTTFHLKGDLDTVTPIGNVAVLSVDEGADPGEGSAVAPYDTEPDTKPPEVTWVWPPDGAEDLALTSRIGLTFNEFIDVKSAWEGSVRLYEADTDPAHTRVDGWLSVQELVVNFWPKEPLKPGTRYTLEVPAGGIADYNGNTVEEPFTMEFTTAGARDEGTR